MDIKDYILNKTQNTNNGLNTNYIFKQLINNKEIKSLFKDKNELKKFVIKCCVEGEGYKFFYFSTM